MSPDAYICPRYRIGVVRADFPTQIQNRAQVIRDLSFESCGSGPKVDR